MLFGGSVAENISYGKVGGEATQGEIEEAARMARTVAPEEKVAGVAGGGGGEAARPALVARGC